MIKSKIEARERALELAVETFKGSNRFSHNDVLEVSKYYTDFLIGDAELPETQSDTELVKAFLEVANNELEKSRDRNNRELNELIKTLQGGNARFVGEVEAHEQIEDTKDESVN